MFHTQQEIKEKREEHYETILKSYRSQIKEAVTVINQMLLEERKLPLCHAFIAEYTTKPNTLKKALEWYFEDIPKEYKVLVDVHDITQGKEKKAKVTINLFYSTQNTNFYER